MPTKLMIVDLETAEADGAKVLVRYRGVLMALSKERILEALQHEEAFFAGSRDEVVKSVAPARKVEEPSLIPPDGKINHAGLSVRIKRVFNYNQGARALRPAHAEHLSVVLDQFDWQIPVHPNTKLDFQLKEMCTWKGVSAELRAKLESFVERYTDARYRRSA